MIMLTLDDAVKVAKRLVNDDMDDDEIIHQELEQKCYIGESDDHWRRLSELIMDINPAEIADHIGYGNLHEWCQTIQVEMQMALMQIPQGGKNETT